MHSTPYQGLTPDRILDALASVGLFGDGRLLALNSYENRVYRVHLEGAGPALGNSARAVVVKFYRPGRWSDAQIREEHDFTRELEADEIPVVAPLAIAGRTLHEFEAFRFAVFPVRGGRAPELDDPETLTRIGGFIGRIHRVGARRPFAERPALDVATFGTEPRDWLLANGQIPAELLAPWQAVAALALDAARACFERAGEVATIRLHGDCHPGNVLWSEGGAHFVDLDDSRSAPRIQDLWMLLSGDRAAMTRQLADLLTGYEDFGALDPAELHLVEALRTLRLLHYSAWLASRWDDPAFPAAFPWFGTGRYWQDRILELREQVAAMDEPPLQP